MAHWFRMYDGVLDDPKVQRLPDKAFRFWVNLLCLASRNNGLITQNSDDLAFCLRLDLGKVRDLTQILVSAGLLVKVEGGYEPHKWAERQYKSDVSTGRVKRFRERSRNGDETAPDTEADTEQNRTEIACRFDEFWLVYPKQVGERDARAAYARASLAADHASILAGAVRYASTIRREGTEPRFVKSPANWLDEGRWTDGGGGALRRSAFNSPEEQEAQRLAHERAYGKAAN